jgi:hypothetical protein
VKVLRIGFILLQLIIATIAAAQESTSDNHSFETVKDKVISAIVAGSDSYSICEHVDRSNKLSYVIKLIPANELLASDNAIIARHFVVQRHTESTGVDFSLYRIQFASNEAAMRALSRLPTEKTGTVADGKVLTRYAARLEANNVYIIRTQSFLDSAVRSFLESFAREEIKIR